MKKAIPIGVSDYERLRKEDYYFVDKSMMIQEFLRRKSIVTLIRRPRRFGKTINMSMMAEFFDVTKDAKEIFKGTAIMDTEYAAEMNQYPTIFLSFANAKGSRRSVIQNIQQAFLELYQKHQQVFADLDEYERPVLQLIKNNLFALDKQDLDGLESALAFLMKQLEKHHGKKVMVFIDEYDTPFIEAHVNGYYEEIRGGLSSLLHNALKASTSLQYAMLTGIQRVAKENIFSDLNNLVVCTVKDQEYAQYFGFTEAETKAALEYYGLKLDEEVKAMEGRDQAFARGYEELIEKGKLETLVRLETSFFEVSSTESLWGLFVNAGYLTIEKVISARDGRYVLCIPNEEIQQEFRDLTASYLNVSESNLSAMINGLRYEERERFAQSYADMLQSLPSYHDLKDENSYHVLFLGMCAWLSNEYEIKSNREAGKGRCDIILKAKKERLPSYVLEFKYLKEADENGLEASARAAIDQIKARRYDIELAGKVILVGLAHAGKEVRIVWQER